MGFNLSKPTVREDRLARDRVIVQEIHRSIQDGEVQIWQKRHRNEIASSISSLVSTFVAFPLDSVKTRMQTYKFNSFSKCVKHTFETEGYKGFFRGVTAPMVSIALVRTISMTTYQRSKYGYAAWIKNNFGVDPLAHANRVGAYPNIYTLACFGAAGATSGSFISVVACPFELTKVSAQVSILMANRKVSSVSEPTTGLEVAASYQNKGTFKTAQNIIKHRGILGLYSGFYLHLMRDTLGTAVYFMTYESTKQLLSTLRGDKSSASPISIALAGGTCGIVSGAIIFPIDTAKSIYQRNCLTACKGETVKKAPIRIFEKRMYRGLSVSMGRSAAINTVFFSCFEFIKKHINEMEDAG